MLKLIGWILKMAAFSVLVLILGSFIKWDGKTISDQVRTHLSYATRVNPLKASKALQGQIQDHWQEMKDKFSTDTQASAAENHKNQLSRATKTAEVDDEEIPPSERQKLRALIRELNSSRGKD